MNTLPVRWNYSNQHLVLLFLSRQLGQPSVRLHHDCASAIIHPLSLFVSSFNLASFLKRKDSFLFVTDIRAPCAKHRKKERERERKRLGRRVSAVSLASCESRGQSKRSGTISWLWTEEKKEKRRKNERISLQSNRVGGKTASSCLFDKKNRLCEAEGARKKLIGRRVFEGEEERGREGEKERGKCGRKSTRIITPR